VVQWKTISDLRSRPDESHLPSSDDPTDGVAQTASPDPVQHSLPTPDATAELAELRRQSDELSAELKKVEAQLDQTEPFLPGLEDPQGAYTGPGKWIGEREPLAQVIINGSGDSMKIQVWGHAPDGGMVAWPELFLQKIFYQQKPKSYWRGLAQLEGRDITDQLMVTFERGGLRVDWLRLPRPQSDIRRCVLMVSKLKRTVE
jgi:hypothetical protein